MSKEQSSIEMAEFMTASATWGEVNMLEDYLTNGADPNAVNLKGDSTLHVACFYGEIECANTLLSSKADVNAKGAEGRTPLHKAVHGASAMEPSLRLKNREAIYANQINLIKLLVGNGANLNAKDDKGHTPKDLAIMCDFYECADVLSELAKLQEKFEQAELNKKQVDEFYQSCQDGNLQSLKSLMELIPEHIDMPNAKRMTPLMIASIAGHSEIVEYLIDQGAKPLHMKDRVGRSALHFASEKGHVAVVKTLLEKQPKILQYEDSGDGTSLHLAAKAGHTEIVKLFLDAAEKGRGLRTPCKQQTPGESSLEYVENIPQECFISVLSTSPQDNRTPLHEAVIGGHTDIVELLVNWIKEHPSQGKAFFHLTGTSPMGTPTQLHPPGTPATPNSARTPSSSTGLNLMTTRGRTPLQEAVKKGSIDIASILIKGGADINVVMRPALDVTANADLTALVESALASNLDMVRFLLKHGATDARLKALTRVLRIKTDLAINIGGVLLCYNKTVSVDTSLIELRRRAGKDSTHLPLPLVINWTSKKLPFVHPSWIPLTLTEPDLPKASGYCITQLNVSDNKLKDLPIEVFQIENLQRLDASRNEIEALPTVENCDEAGWKCFSLTHIDISHNSLTTLPTVIFKLPELKEIAANFNEVRKIPMEFWSATRLQKFHLQHNSVSVLPSPDTSRDSGIGTIDDSHSNLQVSLSIGSVPITSSPALNKLTRITTPVKHSILRGSGGSRGRLQTSPGNFNSLIEKRHSLPTSNNPPRSRLLELYSTDMGGVGFEEESDFEVFDANSTEEDDVFALESLDISYNKLTSIPKSLCCLAPKLKRLHIHHNKLKSLGCITDFPIDLELLDASYNELSTAIACAPNRENIRLLPCAQKLLQASTEPSTPSRCSHRHHRILKKMGYLKLSYNQLIDVQLFRIVVRESSNGSDFTSSIDETKLERRSSTFAEPTPASRKDFSKSSRISSGGSGGGIKDSTNSSEGSGGDSSKQHGGREEVQYCLYPQLSTLDVGYNKLKAIPAHIELISSLAVLTVSHNTSIDTLPLELSNLEGLWSLEYDGVPLTNPSAEDLDKFRSAADKLQYMRSLLHDAKPNQSMKLMLVGLQNRGKTSLLSRLREVNEVESSTTTFNERVMGNEQTNTSISTSFKPLLKRFGIKEAPLSTVGVDVGMWKYRKDLEPSYRAKKGSKQLRSVTFYTWDFGGQEEYYATHQCFLSFRSLYLVIFRMTDGEDGVDRLGPWLHNIQARAPDSPVVIVGTHLDFFKGEFEKEKKKKELRDYIQNKFQFGRPVSQIREMGLPQIKEVVFVGCPSNGRGEGVSELRTMLWDIAFSLTVPRRKGGGGGKSKLLEQQIPSCYLMLQEEVRKLAVQSQHEEDTPPVMKEVEFREATKNIIANSRELDQAVTFLHDNGILLHYATPALNHLYFVDPQWLCDMLAHVVTVPEVNNFVQRGSGPEAGILKTSVLSHLYKGKLFPQAQRKEYIELLGKFEVALLLDHSRLLVPSMLSKAPNYTLHKFPTVFPRPPLANILSEAFSQLQDDSLLSPYSRSTDPLFIQSVPQKLPTSPSLFRTGLLLRRFYFMTYVPSGFWPRLISRFLTSSDFPITILKAIGFSEDQIVDLIPKFVSGESSSIVNLEWSYWTTGLELWYQGWSILRVSEIRLEGTFEGCDSSNIGGHLPRTEPIEPAMDVDDLSFRLNGLWVSVDQAPTTGLEILIPDYVCPKVLEKDYPIGPVPSIVISSKGLEDTESCGEEEEDGSSEGVEIPLQETSWMSSQLLALTVEQIDTLLEDWYPGIGSKDSGKNMYSIPYVNRVVPCPYCVNHAQPYSEKRLKSVSLKEQSNLLEPVDSPSTLTITESRPRNGSDSSTRNVRRTLFSTLNQSADTSVFHGSGAHKRNDDGTLPISTGSIDPNCPIPTQQLVQASKFGFMIESCIAACRGQEEELLVCPVHPTHDMDLKSLVPDLMFGDLPTHFIIDGRLLEQGKYVASGSFGDIYHGAKYPYLSAKDDEAMDVAIKVDKQDKKQFNIDNAAKAYAEIRAEVAILKDLDHENVIHFIGIVLNPLCFVLEWAPRGSLHGILTAYSNADARISPWTLTETARQVANGLEYLHYKHVVYYDLKSPNILVFEFPTPEESTQVSMGYRKLPVEKFPVYIKITDMGISRKLTPGGVIGYKGTPAFMAPEILNYAGKEACTEKVDVFSFGMFLYELVSLQFPFERQNLMHNQIEKLIIEGDRPPLQTRELNNPLLFLDVMRWAWEQDYHNRPSATQLKEVLLQSSVSHLINAYPLQPFTLPEVSASCIVTLPVDMGIPDATESDTDASLYPLNTSHHVHGDLQEEVWLCSESYDPTSHVTETSISVVTFQGKANFNVANIDVGNTPISCMACVNQSVWVGTTAGQVILYDATSHTHIFSRYLSVKPDQSIVYIQHLTKLRQVIVVRKDGCLLLFDENLSEHIIPDCSHYDGFINSTQLPVKSVFSTKHIISSVQDISTQDNFTIWCGSGSNVVVTVEITGMQFSNFERLHAKPFAESSADDTVCKMCLMKTLDGEGREVVYMWTLSNPEGVLYLWDVCNKCVLMTYSSSNFGIQEITDIISMDSYLYIGTSTGTIIVLQLDHDLILRSPCDPVYAHANQTRNLLLLSSRIFPRQWLPRLVGRSNAIEYYKDLLDEEELEDISSRMIGHHSSLLVSIGQGFVGVASNRGVDISLKSDSQDIFLLLWLLPR